MPIFMNLLLAWLWIMQVSQSTFAQNDDIPPDQICTNRDLFNLDDEHLQLSHLPKEWYVARVTLRTLLPSGVPMPEVNCCGPLSYLKSCKGGIYVEREWDAGGVIKITKAYSKKDDNIVEYWESQSILQGSNHFLYSGFGTSMTLHFRGGETKKIQTYDFPELLIYAQASLIAITEYGYLVKTGQIEWILYQGCNEDIAWIEIAQWVIKDKARLDEVNGIIDNYLRDNKLTVPQMIKLEMELPTL